MQGIICYTGLDGEDYTMVFRDSVYFNIKSLTDEEGIVVASKHIIPDDVDLSGFPTNTPLVIV